MNSITQSNQNMFTKASAFDFAAALGSSLLSTCLTQVTLKESAIVGSCFTATIFTVKAIIGNDATNSERVIISVAALALTFYEVHLFAPLISRYLAAVITPQSMINVLAFNAFGQMISFLVSKNKVQQTPIPTTLPSKMNDDQVRAFHQQCLENPQLFNNLEMFEEQFIYMRFKELELNTSTLKPAQYSPEKYQELTPEQFSAISAQSYKVPVYQVFEE